MKAIEEGSNKILFSEADREVRYPRNRSLYATALINGLEVLIDSAASVNIMPINF